MQLPGTDFDIDLSDKSTQIILGGVGLLGAAVFIQGRMNAAKPDVSQPVTANLSPGPGLQWSDVITPPENRGTVGNVGSYPVVGAPGAPGEKGDKGDTGEKGAKGDTGATGKPGTTTQPPVTKPPVTKPPVTKPPVTTGKGYHCPPGSKMTKERGAPQNDVCELPSGVQFQVVYDEPPTARYPADPKTVVPTAKKPSVSKPLATLPRAGEGPNPTPGGTVDGIFASPSFFGSPTFITVKHGDTLKSLSQQYYGTDNMWGKILDANPHARNLRTGQRLRLYG